MSVSMNFSRFLKSGKCRVKIFLLTNIYINNNTIFSNVSSHDITGEFLKVNIIGIFVNENLILVPIKGLKIRGVCKEGGGGK